jgi:hypothetical protein
MKRAPRTNRQLSGATRADLSEDLALTLQLMESPWRWRQRAVETFYLESENDVRVTTSYQIEFPPEMLSDLGLAKAENANVILPVTARPKRPLLRFDIETSHGAPAHVLQRLSIASIEASYVRELAEKGPATHDDLAGLTDELLEAMFVFTPQFYKQLLENYGRVNAIRVYLESGIGLVATDDDVERWLETTDMAASLLLRALEEAPDVLSSSENVLLAVPRLASLPQSVAEVDRIVEQYSNAIAAATRAGDNALLAAIGEYGRRWEMLVEVEIPLLRPAVIKVCEDRPLEIEGSGWIWQNVAIGEVPSAHVQFVVPDQAIEIDDFDVRRTNGQSIGLGSFEGVRHTRDTLALYTSVPERPFFVDVGIRLLTAPHIRKSTIAAIVVILSAAAAIGVVGHGDDLVERLTLLVLPTTIGGTIVLTREQSSLATSLNARARRLLAASLLFLWIILLARVFNEGVLSYVHRIGHIVRSIAAVIVRAVT